MKDWDEVSEGSACTMYFNNEYNLSSISRRITCAWVQEKVMAHEQTAKQSQGIKEF